MNKADIILIDAKYLLWRAVAGNPEEPVGLWFHYFLQAKRDYLADDGEMIICWDDDGRTTQRRIWFPDYKKARGEKRMREMARIAKGAYIDVRQALRFTSIRQALAPKWEADDVIGTLVKKLVTDGVTSIIFSADRDFYQLLRPGVFLMNVKKDKYTFMDGEGVEEKLGIPVEQVYNLKALSGDSGDGVPGVMGIGPKKASKLLRSNNFNLKACADELGVDYPTIKLYRALVRIRENVTIEWTIGEDDPKRFVVFALAIGAKSLLQARKYRGLYD